MNAYERVEALLISDRNDVLTVPEVRTVPAVLTVPGTFVVRGGDAEAALRKWLLKHGVPDSVTLVPMAHVSGLRVFIGRAPAKGDLLAVTIREMDASLKARAPNAPAVARLAALTVAKHAHKLTEA